MVSDADFVILLEEDLRDNSSGSAATSIMGRRFDLLGRKTYGFSTLASQALCAVLGTEDGDVNKVFQRHQSDVAKEQWLIVLSKTVYEVTLTY